MYLGLVNDQALNHLTRLGPNDPDKSNTKQKNNGVGPKTSSLFSPSHQQTVKIYFNGSLRTKGIVACCRDGNRAPPLTIFFPLLTKTPLCESSDPAEATYQS